MYDMKQLAKFPRLGELAPEAFKAFVAFDEAAESGTLRPGMNVLSVTFGAGLTWGATVVRW